MILPRMFEEGLPKPSRQELLVMAERYAELAEDAVEASPKWSDRMNAIAAYSSMATMMLAFAANTQEVLVSAGSYQHTQQDRPQHPPSSPIKL